MASPHTAEQLALLKGARVALKNLEPRQRKFVEAFCVCLNATQAAKSAGYSPRTARSIGSENLTKPDIRRAILAVFSTSAMAPEEIAARWTALARAGLADFFTKVEYQEATKVQQPLAAYIADKHRQMQFEQKVHERQQLESPEDAARHFLAQRRRLNEIVRLQVELEEYPQATRTIDGPAVTKYRMELDLVKAAELGLLDLVKTITPGEYGTRVELRSPDEALGNLAKWQGMLTTKVDLTSGGQPIAPPPIVGVLSADTLREVLAARRRLREEGQASE